MMRPEVNLERIVRNPRMNDVALAFKAAAEKELAKQPSDQGKEEPKR